VTDAAGRPLPSLLAEFDGRRTAPLERIREAGPPSTHLVSEALGFIDADDARIAAAATWLLRAWWEDGLVMEAGEWDTLVSSLAGVSDPWACLHLAQSVRVLDVPDRHANDVAAFLERCRASDRPFLRAWAMDGLVQLGRTHRRFRTAGDAALADAFEDPAASVRARARRVAAASPPSPS